MTANVRDASIVRSTINLAHDLGLRVVGEGVESADALAMIGASVATRPRAITSRGRSTVRRLPLGWTGAAGGAPARSSSGDRGSPPRAPRAAYDSRPHGTARSDPAVACRRGLRLPGRELRRLHHRTAAVRSAFALFNPSPATRGGACPACRRYDTLVMRPPWARSLRRAVRTRRRWLWNVDCRCTTFAGSRPG